MSFQNSTPEGNVISNGVQKKSHTLNADTKDRAIARSFALQTGASKPLKISFSNHKNFR